MDITIGSQYKTKMRRDVESSTIVVTVIATPPGHVDYEFLDDDFNIRRGVLEQVWFEAFFTPV